MSGGAKITREGGMAVEDGTDGVADGFIEVIPLYEHREEAGDGTSREITCSFADLRQEAEDGRRVAFLAGRLAGCQADLALSHGESSDGVHDEKHVFTLVA